LQGKIICRHKERVTGEARLAGRRKEMWGWKDRKTAGQNCGGGEEGRQKDIAVVDERQTDIRPVFWRGRDKQTEGQRCSGGETGEEKQAVIWADGPRCREGETDRQNETLLGRRDRKK
jgi:hypothetical protein